MLAEPPVVLFATVLALLAAPAETELEKPKQSF